MIDFVDVELKGNDLVLINKRNISMIRTCIKDGFQTLVIHFCGDECLELSRNPEHTGFTGLVELDDLLEKITGDKGRY